MPNILECSLAHKDHNVGHGAVLGSLEWGKLDDDKSDKDSKVDIIEMGFFALMTFDCNYLQNKEIEDYNNKIF